MMKMMIFYAIGAALLTAPAAAQRLTAREIARLEQDVAVGLAISRDLDSRARHLDRAYRAARGIDRVIGTTTNRVPGGRLAYEGGQAVGRELYQRAKRWTRR